MTIISFCTQHNINYALCSPDFTSLASMIENVCSLNETSDTASFFLVWLESEEETHVSLSIFLGSSYNRAVDCHLFSPLSQYPSHYEHFLKPRKMIPNSDFFLRVNIAVWARTQRSLKYFFQFSFRSLVGARKSETFYLPIFRRAEDSGTTSRLVRGPCHLYFELSSSAKCWDSEVTFSPFVSNYSNKTGLPR